MALRAMSEMERQINSRTDAVNGRCKLNAPENNWKTFFNIARNPTRNNSSQLSFYLLNSVKEISSNVLRSGYYISITDLLFIIYIFVS